MAVDTFPFRPDVLARLEGLRDAGRLGQPLLLTGPSGTGREATALELARRLNCVAPATCAEGTRCESCVKILAYQHPDVRWLGPAPATIKDDDVAQLLAAKSDDAFHSSPWAATARIVIGDPEHPGPMSVRALIRFMRRRAFQSPWQVAVVADAQRLNVSAANALLKTLEEPPPRSLLVLVAPGREGLLPTIVSRCLPLAFEPWPAGELADLLLARGAPDRETALQAARVADGDARRAMDLLKPASRMLGAWARVLYRALQEGNAAVSALTADDLHRGVVPEECLPPELGAKEAEAREPAQRRRRAIQLCETLNILYSDTVACRERGEAWQPRLAAAAEEVGRAAAVRSSSSLLEDMARIETARRDIDRNLNIGLVMAVLGEDLIEHARRDRP